MRLRSSCPLAAVALFCSILGSGCRPQSEGSEGHEDRGQQQVEAEPAPVKKPPRAAAPAPVPSGEDAGTQKPTAKEVREKVSALPPQEEIDRVVNPLGKKPYAGPTGHVRGRVLSSGDQPLPLEKALASMEKDCTLSRQMFSSIPREGKNRTLADVFVAVTGYEGFLPQREKDVVVTASGCAWDRRTVGMMFGQNLQIKSGDRRAYVPELLGQQMPAQLFVLPDAQPVNLPPRKPGQFRLLDSMRLYNLADVVVVSYPTFDVTGLDGRFEIEGVPVGKAKVNALLPATGAVTGQDIEIKEGQFTEVTLTLPFDAAEMAKVLSQVGTSDEPRRLPNLK